MTEYAFGDDEMQGVQCPARQAGYEPSEGDESTRWAEAWDDRVQLLTGLDEGVVPEQTARQEWIKVIERSDAGSDGLRVAEEIAMLNGWL
jgi:hypothetical protein